MIYNAFISRRIIAKDVNENGGKSLMLSKEEILAYVQQGQAQPGWNVLRPDATYLTKQTLLYGILSLVIIVLGVMFLNQSSLVFVPLGVSDPSNFQMWRYIDIAVLAAFFCICLVIALRNLLELNTLQHQLLVLLPDGFLLKKRNTEQFVAYPGVTGISARASRYGYVTLNIKAVGSNVSYKVQLDGRYGNARALASQIIGAQRQYAKNQRSSLA
jgi:hypothetical protein